MDLTRRVLHTIRRHALVRRGDRLLVALSGGSDSVALLLLLGELEAAGELVVAGVAHLNHGLRKAATDDEQFCRALAASRGVPFRSDLVDVRGRAARLKTSLEDAGRTARYELYARVSDELAADVVATGHTRDDQAETFLLRLLRGAGPRGLSGIHPKVGRTIRPLLEVSRDELRDYLAGQHQEFREDESNRDVSIPRNRIRHELLPLLSREYSPAVVDVLAREAEIARADDDYLTREAIDLLGSVVLNKESVLREDGRSAEPIESVTLDAARLAALHPAMAARVVRLGLAMVAGERFVGADHVSRVLELVQGSDAGRAELSLPGQQVIRTGGTLVLGRAQAQPEPFANSFRVQLSIPGEAIAGGWVVSAALTEGDSQRGHSKGTATSDSPQRGQTTQAVAVDELVLPLAIRSRRPGDRIRPLGMGGQSKKLQDVLVDRKVGRNVRDFLPLVVDQHDRIVWVVGGPLAEDFRVTEASQGVILLKARRLGGQG